MNRAARHLAPAGLQMKRGVSSIDVNNSFGTASGQLLSELPVDAGIRQNFHYSSAQGPSPGKVSSPTSVVVSAQDVVPKALREERGMDYSAHGRGLGASGGQTKEGFVRPSWQQINPDYRTDWTVTRQRYNLASRNGDNQTPPSLITASPRKFAASPTRKVEATTKGASVQQSVQQTAAGRLLADLQKEATAALPELNKHEAKRASNRPSWSIISEDYKHDWGMARERYDLLRFNSHMSLHNPHGAMTDRHTQG